MAKEKKESGKVVSGKRFKVTQIRSTSRCTQTQLATLAAMGLRGRQKAVVLADNPANRGQILKVQHLVTVEVVKA